MSQQSTTPPIPEQPEQAMPERRSSRRRLRSFGSRVLRRLAVATLPRLYMAYMRFVYATSTVTDLGLEQLKDITREHGGSVGLLWHEEVFTVAYGYHYLGFTPHTLASRGIAGEIITDMLRRCGFVVFRGGSKRRSRRAPEVVKDMIAHMNARDDVIYGLTIDGSHGPAYRMKRGGLAIARTCNKPLIVTRTWYKRYFRLNTWDRTAIPLPFNRITVYFKGPYFPGETRTAEELERLRMQVEDDLIDLTIRSYKDIGKPIPENLTKRTAEEREAIFAEARTRGPDDPAPSGH